MLSSMSMIKKEDQKTSLHDLDDTFEIHLNKYAPVPNKQQDNQEPNPKQHPTQLEKFKMKKEEFKKPFSVPNLPQGKSLEFNIVDTWGDANYLGLTGIEIFD